jgi:hypothetical protein
MQEDEIEPRIKITAAATFLSALPYYVMTAKSRRA